MARLPDLDEIARVTGGRILAGAGSARPTGVAIDSRKVRPGDLFFALPGSRVDGHGFVADARSRGACGAVVSTPVECPAGASLVQVADTSRALRDLGRHLRLSLGLRVVGITGSTGKTTTKELTAAALRGSLRVHASEGNLNNLFGVPLVLGNLPEDADTAVLEMGISTPGEMDDLASIAQPDVAVVTLVAPVHTEFFRSFGDLVREKARIWAHLREGGTAIVPADDAPVMAAWQALGLRRRVIRFGRSEGAEVRILGAEPEGVTATRVRVSVEGREIVFRLPLPGAHNARNALAALAVAVALGVPAGIAAGRLEGARPVPGRGLLIRFAAGFDVLDESYNSNPRAMEAVLDLVAGAPGYRRRCLVSGDMLELGAEGAARHRETGALAARSGLDVLAGVGPLSTGLVDAAREAGLGAAVHFATAGEAAAWVVANAREGDLWVIKGSRGIRTDEIVERLRASFPLEAGGGVPGGGRRLRAAGGEG